LCSCARSSAYERRHEASGRSNRAAAHGAAALAASGRQQLLASNDSDGGRAAEEAALQAVTNGGHLHHLVIVPKFWQSITGDGWRINASTEHLFCDYLEGQIEREILEHLGRVNAAARARGIRYSAGPEELLLNYPNTTAMCSGSLRRVRTLTGTSGAMRCNPVALLGWCAERFGCKVDES
jgi:hypothetical protein